MGNFFGPTVAAPVVLSESFVFGPGPMSDGGVDEGAAITVIIFLY